MPNTWHSLFRTPRAVRQSAFTVIELLVVVSIIVVLVGAVVVAGNLFINDARVKNTRAVQLIVRDALDQFKSEQSTHPTLTRMKDSDTPPKFSYVKRYGLFPPDELEGFTPAGIPGSGGVMKFFSGGAMRNWQLVPPLEQQSGFPPMKFAVAPGIVDPALENRDLAAMLLSVELFCEPAASMLKQIPERNRAPGPQDPTGIPTRFVDRDQSRDGRWGTDDLSIPLIVDDWGHPLGYFSQRDWVRNPSAENPQVPRSSNHSGWSQASTQMIELNQSNPLIFSYGPDGKHQRSADIMGTDGKAESSLPTDWLDNNADHKINHPLNKDNVYPDASFNEKLFRGLP